MPPRPPSRPARTPVRSRAGAAPKGGRSSTRAAGNGTARSAAHADLAKAFGGAWEYAPAPETVKVVIARRYGHFIGGRFVEPTGETTASGGSPYFSTINPATEGVLAEVAQGSAADVDRAVAAAREALPAWQALPASERAKYIFRISRRIQERARELAVLETINGGKPIRESRDVDIPLAAAHFFYHAGWADKLDWVFGPGGTARRAVLPNPPVNSPLTTHHSPSWSPVGVCAQIIPWNFPLLMAAWKLAPALACGNTVVLKPAETTPLTALRLAEIIQEIDLPPGVVNIVTGDGRTGAALVNHPGVDKIAFTGSTEVGKRIAKAVAGTRKRLTLELGGKSPHIIFEDASLDQAIEGIVQGIYFNQGHVCCAGSRLLVQESIEAEVIKRLKRRLATLRIGDPLDKNTDVGAINSRGQLDTIRRYLAIGEREAECHIGGVLGQGLDRWKGGGATPDASTNGSLKGFWCRPCLFTGVQPSAAIAREEIFGPVLAVTTFRTPEEAIQRANNTPYGLAAGVWTDKGSKVFEVAARLKAGVIWCNTYNMFDPAAPFGGYKESGFGREGGMQGLRAYVRLAGE